MLLSYEGHFLIYNSRTNNFYEISHELYNNLDCGNFNKIADDTLSELQKIKILCTDEDDECYYNSMKLKRNIVSYSTSNLQITVAPTISCNLKCPYCFEKNKPTGIMTNEICNSFVDFIASHKNAKSYSLTWFGGEPLIAIDKIQYILSKLKLLTNIECTSHSIITNATLLKGKALDVFKEFPLSFLQVTLDGTKETHDMRRIYFDGRGTFDCIIENILNFTEECPNTSISFRINIDKLNANQYIDVKQYIDKIFNGKNVYVYPGYLQGDCDCDINSSFLTSKDVLDLHKSLNEKGTPLETYPSHKLKGCTATCISGYVIGPFGEIYHCWEDVGRDDKICGNIRNNNFSNEKILYHYMILGDCFNSEECHQCPMLPICYGGCPKHRVENKLYGAKHELCAMYRTNNNEGLKYLLFQFYKNKKGQSQNEHQ